MLWEGSFGFMLGVSGSGSGSCTFSIEHWMEWTCGCAVVRSPGGEETWRMDYRILRCVALRRVGLLLIIVLREGQVMTEPDSALGQVLLTRV